MAKQIKHLDYYNYFETKEDVDNRLKDKQIINIETLGSKVRFWYLDSL